MTEALKTLLSNPLVIVFLTLKGLDIATKRR